MPQPPAKPHGKPQEKPGQKPQGIARHNDFNEEYVNRLVDVTLANGTVLRGTILEVRKYWLKVLIDGKPHYVNKAYIVEVVPA